MKLSKLIDHKDKTFGRGWIFRCPGQYPYEAIFDFMIREDLDSPSQYSLIVVSGFKSGCTFLSLPKESLASNGAVSAEWLVQNWQNWIYPDCAVEDVWFYRNEIN